MGNGPYRLILAFDRITTEQAATRRGFRRVGNMNLDGFVRGELIMRSGTRSSAFPAPLTNTELR
jgi:hypothetical protein